MKYGYNIFFPRNLYTQYIAYFIIYMVVLSRNRDIMKSIAKFIEWRRAMSVEYGRLFERIKNGEISGAELAKKRWLVGML